MTEDVIDANELAFLNEMEKHENQWIAFVRSNGAEVIVGSGDDAVDAMAQAEAKGFPDAILLRVPPFDRGYIPTFNAR
jgi:hypothetical protein